MANLGCWIRKPPRFPSQTVPPAQTTETGPKPLAPVRAPLPTSCDDVSQLASSPPRDALFRGRDPRDFFADEGCANFSRRLRFGSCSSSRNPSPTPANLPTGFGFGLGVPLEGATGLDDPAAGPAAPVALAAPQVGRVSGREPHGSARRCESFSPPGDHAPRASSPLTRESPLSAPQPRSASRPVPIPERKVRGPGARAARDAECASPVLGGVVLSHRRGLPDPYNKSYTPASDSYGNGYASDGTDFESGSPGTPMFPFEV